LIATAARDAEQFHSSDICQLSWLYLYCFIELFIGFLLSSCIDYLRVTSRIGATSYHARIPSPARFYYSMFPRRRIHHRLSPPKPTACHYRQRRLREKSAPACIAKIRHAHENFMAVGTAVDFGHTSMIDETFRRLSRAANAQLSQRMHATLHRWRYRDDVLISAAHMGLAHRAYSPYRYLGQARFIHFRRQK